MKVLMASDGSATAAAALNCLITHLRQLAEMPEVHLMFVHPPVPIGLARQHIGHDVLERYYREEGEAALKPAQDLLTAQGIHYSSHIHVGEPAETIVAVAHDLGCTLICLGSHGRGALANAVVGSVVAKVLHTTNIPVLVAR